MKYLLSFLLFPILVQAQIPMPSPTDTLKLSKEEVTKYVLANKTLKDKAFKAGLKKILIKIFDTEETSKRSLGKNWKTFNEEQQKEFVFLFSELLLNNYAEKFKQINQTEVIFKHETVEQDKAMVETLVKAGEDNFQFNYKMHLSNCTWKIYDIVIENISLVNNYRSEFSSIIEREGVEGLLNKLRNKIN